MKGGGLLSPPVDWACMLTFREGLVEALVAQPSRHPYVVQMKLNLPALVFVSISACCISPTSEVAMSSSNTQQIGIHIFGFWLF